MKNKILSRLVLRDDDVLVVKIPMPYPKRAIKSLYTQIKKQLYPRNNKILMIPNDIDFSVIGNKEIKEHVTELDLWHLWDEDGEIINKEDL